MNYKETIVNIVYPSLIVVLLAFTIMISIKPFQIDDSVYHLDDNQIATVSSALILSNTLDKKLAFNILDSTVKIKSGSAEAPTSGTGVTIWSTKHENTIYSYIITNRHVVTDSEVVLVEQFKYLNNKKIAEIVTYEGRVVAKGVLKDLALIEIKSPRTVGKVSLFITKKELKNVSLYDPIYACGCALGNPPFITSGNLAVYGDKHHIVTAFGIFGSSGGGVFTQNGKILGIVVQISGLSIGKLNIPVPNLTTIISTTEIRHWLSDSDYSFVLGPKHGSFDE